MKKINSFVLSIAMSVLSAMVLFATCSTNHVPLDEVNLEETPQSLPLIFALFMSSKLI